MQIEPQKINQRIRLFDVSPHQTASIRSIANYMQDAADENARRLGFSYAQLPEGRAWVMIRTHIEMQRYPNWFESFQIETWPSGTDRYLAFREFILTDEADHVIGRGSTHWIMLDLEKRKPGRVPESFADLKWPDRPRNFTDLPRLEPLERVDFETSFVARYDDQDVMGHTNNAVYISWVAEAVPAEYLHTHELQTIDVVFRAECVMGDRILAQTQDMGDGRFLHQLIRAEDQKEVVLAYTVWR